MNAAMREQEPETNGLLSPPGLRFGLRVLVCHVDQTPYAESSEHLDQSLRYHVKPSPGPAAE